MQYGFWNTTKLPCTYTYQFNQIHLPCRCLDVQLLPVAHVAIYTVYPPWPSAHTYSLGELYALANPKGFMVQPLTSIYNLNIVYLLCLFFFFFFFFVGAPCRALGSLVFFLLLFIYFIEPLSLSTNEWGKGMPLSTHGLHWGFCGLQYMVRLPRWQRTLRKLINFLQRSI